MAEIFSMKFTLEINRSTLYFDKGWEAKFHKIIEEWVLEDLRNNKTYLATGGLIDYRKFVLGPSSFNKQTDPIYRVLETREIIKQRYHWETPNCEIELKFDSWCVTMWFTGRRGALWGYNGPDRSKFVAPLATLLLEIAQYEYVLKASGDTWVFRIQHYETTNENMSWLDGPCGNALDNWVDSKDL